MLRVLDLSVSIRPLQTAHRRTATHPPIRATLNKSVRVELVETYLLKINNLQIASTGSARTDGLVQHCLRTRESSAAFRHRPIKKSIGLLCPRTEMIYTLVDQVQQKANILQACRVLQASRAGYYAARQRAKEPAICVASVQVKAAFMANQSCYGSRRVVDELKAQGSQLRFRQRQRRIATSRSTVSGRWPPRQAPIAALSRWRLLTTASAPGTTWSKEYQLGQLQSLKTTALN